MYKLIILKYQRLWWKKWDISNLIYNINSFVMSFKQVGEWEKWCISSHLFLFRFILYIAIVSDCLSVPKKCYSKYSSLSVTFSVELRHLYIFGTWETLRYYIAYIVYCIIPVVKKCTAWYSCTDRIFDLLIVAELCATQKLWVD